MPGHSFATIPTRGSGCWVWSFPASPKYADVTVHGDRLTIKGERKAERYLRRPTFTNAEAL